MFDFIANEFKREIDDDLIVYHGSRKGLQGKIEPISREFCDFGKGFYLGTNPVQSLTLVCDEEKPVFYTMKLNLTDLKVLKNRNESRMGDAYCLLSWIYERSERKRDLRKISKNG